MSTSSKPINELSAEEKRALLAQMLQKSAPVPRSFVCSFAQERLWLLHQLTPGDIAYNVPVAVRLSGALDTAALERSINGIVARHEVLRTVFALVDGRPMQIVKPALTIPLPINDLSAVPLQHQEELVQQLATAEAQRPFDLALGPLLRVCLLRLSATEHVVLLSMHHIISDAWSMGVFVRELAALYSAYTSGQTARLPDLPIQYADFAAWQRQWLQGDVLAVQLAFWREQLAGELAALELPTDHPRPLVQTSRGASYPFVLPVALSSAIKQLSQGEGATLFMILLAAFQVLLYRYSGQPDIRVGTPIANRQRVDLEPLIGFFVNTLVLRADCAANPSFRALLRQVRERALGAYAHQDLPFEKLVEALRLERDLSRTPLFQAMFMLQNAPQPPLELAGLTIRPLEIESGTAKFDLTLVMIEDDRQLAGELVYNSDLFEAPTIARMLAHFQVLLEGIVAEPDRRIGDLPLLTAAERQELLFTLNATQRAYPATTMHALFEAQVERTPEAIAVACADPAGARQTMSYAELNTRANQLAHYLRGLGAGPGTLVGLCLERSPAVLVAMLGILKAGAAYVPLDPSYPRERLALMLEDSRAALLVTQQPLLAGLLTSGVTVVCLDTDQDLIAQATTTNCVSGASAADLAYVIYTSGSTGTPKGSAIPHRGLVNYLHWAAEAYAVADGCGAPVHSSIAFDLTITGLFLPLLVGRTVQLLPETLGPVALSTTLRPEANFSLVKITPAHLELLRQQLAGQELAGRTRALIIGGEQLLAEQLVVWQHAAPATRLVNEYGPTETVVGCCVYTVPPDLQTSGPIPIGRPIANTQLYILDRHMQPVPIGVPGELYIGGDGVAWGYLNRPSLTAEKFVPDPFGATPGAQLYRTGDLVRHRADGNLDYLGRIDLQVKVRGYRVELGEIEAVLRAHPALDEAVVVLRELAPGDKRLVAYVVLKHPEAEQAITAQLRDFLAERMPEYMLPSAFVLLEALPLTVNGKVDRKALPAPAALRPELATTYVAPQSELERTIAGIWQEVLGLDRVGMFDNFFDLGGHSLLLVQVQNKLRVALNRDIPLVELFQYPTIAALAQALRQNEEQQPVFQQSYERAEARRELLARRGQRRQSQRPSYDQEESDEWVS